MITLSKIDPLNKRENLRRGRCSQTGEFEHRPFSFSIYLRAMDKYDRNGRKYRTLDRKHNNIPNNPLI